MAAADHEEVLLYENKIAPLDDPAVWATAKKVKASEEGSSGAFIVSTGKGAIVVKAGMQVAQEVFANLLAEKIGVECIRVPKIRMVKHTDEEHTTIKEKLLTLSITISSHDRIHKELNRPYYMVMQFVDGYAWAGMPDATMARHPTVLKQVGSCIAFDMLVNNWDRVPLIWNNEGNLMNLFVQLPPGRDVSHAVVVGIDQSATCLIDVSETAKAATIYQTNLKTLVDSIFRKEVDLEPFQKVAESLKTWTGIELSNTELTVVREGVIAGVRAVVANLTKEKVEETLDEVTRMVGEGQDWENVWSSMVQLIHIEFIVKNLEIYAAAVASADKE